MAFLILSQISIGIILALIAISLDKVGRGFFSFHAALALSLEAIALALDRSRMPAFAPYGASLLILTVLYQVRKLRWTGTLIRLTALLGAAALVWIAGPSTADALALVSSAWVLGAVLVAMNLGHWYLVIRGLPIDLLGVANRRLIQALVLRIACIAIGVILAREAWAAMWTAAGGPMWDKVLFLTVRVAFGLAAPLVLSWMVHECVKIKSNQSATGILYVSVVFILIGELSGLYFLLHRGVPL
ncbi:MAG: hypothetical protein A3G34_15320 [Candidatus Lindowbacteria bacterium RIFCSPLOWO2_12_FULL_62_27]|nr:MAG: hypothetical protein A3G34_15320 [Candidatus Lindowbacteria bacterium RIFCSPLOWO2_12_FULL_62_27]OGH63915.1 MAG: hypothetical protein A3I06_05095 [Candidatus Lindowbacteria bacterium RIFCSPLOWO2_02_FULL_62_12]